MNNQNILADLLRQRELLQQAINALQSIEGAGPFARRKRRPMSKEARQRISTAMSQAWARRKGQTSVPGAPPEQKKDGRRFMSAEARQRLSEAMRKRWEERKNAAAAAASA